MPSDPASAYSNLQAERAYLGTILLDPVGTTNGNFEPLAVDSFFSEAHRIIYRTMLEIREAGREIEFVGLCERLTNKGLIEKAGGGAYLTSLTDGVPVGASPAFSEYARIVREKAALRQIVNLAQNLIARAGEGAEPGVLLNVARSATEELFLQETASKAVAEQAKAKKEGKPVGKVARLRTYPDVPKAAWYGASSLYLKAFERTTNASNNYHLAAFLTMAGVLLGKSVFISEGADDTYPNLFTVIVGESGRARKDTAVNRAMKLMRGVDGSIVLLPTINSVEGFVDELQVEQKQLEAKGIKPPLRLMVRFRELKKLIAKAGQSANSGIMSFLCELYDNPPELKTPVRSKPAHVDEPVGCIMAATCPEWLKDMEIGDLEAGLGSRTIFVPGDPKPRLRRREAPDREFIEPLKILLGQRLAVYRREGPARFEFTREAREMFDNWADAVDSKRSGNPLIDSLTARDEETCRKVALIHAALQNTDRWEIDADQTAAAIVFTDFLYESRFPIFSEHGLSPMAEIDNRIVKRVKQSMPFGIIWGELRRALQRIDYELFEKRVHLMEQGVEPVLRSVQVGRTRRIFAVEP
jgi:hypothetical protein